MRDIFEYHNNFAIYADVNCRLLYGNQDRILNPRVSILIPVYKRHYYLRNALDSVMNQTYDGTYEIIVVDNNDTIAGKNQNQLIVEAMKSDKILYYRNDKNIGMFGNWNRCIELARSPRIVFCHDDDMLLPNSLELLMTLADKNPGKAIFGRKNNINSNGELINKTDLYGKNKLGFLQHKQWYKYRKEDVFVSSPGFGCGCLFDRENVIKIGGFNPEFYPSADYALNAVYIFKFGGVYSQIPTFNYRIAENESYNVYEQFVEVDRHFRRCMASRMKWPRFLLNKIIEANYNLSKLNFAVSWGKKDKSLLQRVSLWDRIIMRIVQYKLSFNHLSIFN